MKLRQNGTVFLMIKLAASMVGPGLNSKQIERRTSVSFSIRPAVFLAGGWAEHSKHLLIAIPNRDCLTHLIK
jgi:hypothetical protein